MESYLALRQQLKQSIREKMQRDSGSATDSIGGDSRNIYGCFFGPAETVFTGKAVKEVSDLWSKFKSTDVKKNYAMAKPAVTVDAAATRKKKAQPQRFKESRDYSFLSSTATPPQKRALVLKEPTKSIVKLGGSVITKNPRKSMKGDQKESKKSCVSKQQRPEQKKERELVENRRNKQPEKKKKEGEGQVEKREKEGGDDQENYAINLIREMFGYDPTTFSDDGEEESKMEASFADIQKEERRSAKIATMEDREELRKLETQCRKKRKLTN